jgi:dihydroorotate dehydrogenase (NAD+) catalytic subunit
MRVQFAGIQLENPVIAASGTFGYGVEFEDIVSLEKIGGFVTKGISREPMAGNAAPRIIETAAGMMNAIGLQNIGVQAFIQKKLPEMKRYPKCAVIVNVFGYHAADYVEVVRQLNDAEGIAAYELNASCPNTDHGGMAFGTDPVALDELVWRVKQIATRPVIVKLSPNVTSIPAMAKCAQEAGADAISLINTFVALAIDVETRRPRIANITGGLSGPAIKPIAVRMVWEAANAVTIPIMGLGGIVTAEDAVEFLLAGATAVQIGTASYADPRAIEHITKGLESWCTRHHLEKVTDIIGKLDTSRPQP